MMSFQKSRNKRQQFSISNQKLPRCYDNGSYLPDSLPQINCNDSRNLKLKEQDQTQVRNHFNAINNNNNNSIIGIGKTLKMSDNNIGMWNDNCRQASATHNTLASEDDVLLALNDNLPVIMSDLSLHQKRQMSFSTNSTSDRKTLEKTLNVSKSGKVDKKISVNSFSTTKEDVHNKNGVMTSNFRNSYIESQHIRETLCTNIETKICKDVDKKQSGCLNIAKRGQEEEERDTFLTNFELSKKINTKRKRLNQLKRSATNDDNNMKDQHKSYDSLPRCKSIDSTNGFRSYVDEEASFFSEQVKPVKSKRKLLRRSMSVGFSKFKLITSNLSLRSHQKFNDENIDIDFDEIEHQTSRRKNTNGSTADDEITAEDLFKNKKLDSFIDGTVEYPPLLRSLSAPDPLDMKEGDDEYDEDLAELHLPRRRAICPNLPVPAMKQLKTYLILTRLKQYCFV